MTTSSNTVRRSAAVTATALAVAGSISALAAPAASATPTTMVTLCSVTNPSPFFPGAVTAGTGNVDQAMVPNGHSQVIHNAVDFTYWGNPQVSGVDYKRTVHVHWHNLNSGKSGDAETTINVPGAAGPSNGTLNAIPTGAGDVVMSMTTRNLGPISVPSTCTGKPFHVI